MLAAALAPACTVLLRREIEQCGGDGDCAKLGDFACDAAEGVCVARGSSADYEALPALVDADRTLTADREYLLKNVVVVKPGVTLTIDPGVVLHGDYASKGALVVARGAKIVARGRRDAPVVFTSSQPAAERRPGDWGGVFVFGRARANRVGDGQPNEDFVDDLEAGEYNRYGGTGDELDDADDSGVLSYVRIEYGGTLPLDDVDALVFGGVGSGTTVDHVQVRMAADDCFQFSGGTVRASHLACQSPGEVGVNWNHGYRGKMQFVVVQSGADARSDNARGVSGSNDEFDAYTEPLSEPTIANVTLCGPRRDAPPEQIGVLFGDATGADLSKFIVTGYRVGVDVESKLDLAQNPELVARMVFRESLFFGNTDQNVAYPETGTMAPLGVNNDLGFPDAEWWRGEPPFGAANDANVE
ncbi:MAG TPA: hypothetical protein VFS00_02750, partial [Polyangiaceae bacterium]|nr:hypothetical protein [Polyangiaceae bacterium]